MKPEHREILNKLEAYLEQPGAEHLRFWQALYGVGVIKGDFKPLKINGVEVPNMIISIRDDFNLSDEDLLKRMK